MAHSKLSTRLCNGRRSRENAGGGVCRRRGWVVRKWCDFISQFMAPHFFSRSFSIDLFHLLFRMNAQLLSWIQSGKWWYTKGSETKQKKKKIDGTILVRERNRWCFGTSIKREIKFLLCVCVWENCMNSICLLIHEITTLDFRWHYFLLIFFLILSAVTLAADAGVVLAESCYVCIYSPNDVHFGFSQVCMFRFNCELNWKMHFDPANGSIYALHFDALPISKSHTRSHTLTRVRVCTSKHSWVSDCLNWTS